MIRFKIKSLFKPVNTALLLVAFVAGCGGGEDGGLAASGESTTSTAATTSVVAVAPGMLAALSTRPTVVSASPSNNATNVPTSSSSNNVVTGTVVTATFSQPMNPATISSSLAAPLSTFTLKDTAGTNIPGSVAMNAANTVATFTPSAVALAPNTGYTATVSIAAKNAGGIAMVIPVAWKFTTKAVASTAQAPVNLGTAGNFVVLAKTGISTTGTTAVTGNIGVSPVAASFITGFGLIADSTNTFSTSSLVAGKVFAADYTEPTPTNMTTAVSNMETAYTDAAGRTLPDFTELGAGEIGGLTLVPGLYKWGTDVAISTGVTLAGGPNDVWIFQIAGKLTQASAAKVTLTGGALAKNVFWQVADNVTIGTTAHLEGVVLAKTLIAMNTGASANGRLLAQTAVTLDQNAVTQPAQTTVTPPVTNPPPVVKPPKVTKPPKNQQGVNKPKDNKKDNKKDDRRRN